MGDVVNRLLAQAADVLAEILKLDFNVQMAEGTLSTEIFNRYLNDDNWYLEQYATILKNIEDRENSPLNGLGFSEYITKAELEVRKMNPAKINQFILFAQDSIEHGPVINNYVTHLKQQAVNPSLAVAIVACIPCFWVYSEIGKELKIAEKNHNQNYIEWLKTYVHEDFVQKKDDIFNAFEEALKLEPYKEEALFEVFNLSLQFELNFFKSVMLEAHIPEPKSLEAIL